MRMFFGCLSHWRPAGENGGEHQPALPCGYGGSFQQRHQCGTQFLIGQPNIREKRIDNPIYMPGALGILAFGHLNSSVQGLDDFPENEWPTNIDLLYYAFHVMAGLGTVFILLMGIANFQRWRGRLETSRGLLWALMLAFPFPYIATTAGWMTTELEDSPGSSFGFSEPVKASAML